MFSGILMSCYDMGRLQPNSCYLNRTADDCCQTCTSIRDNKKPAGHCNNLYLNSAKYDIMQCDNYGESPLTRFSCAVIVRVMAF